MAPFSAWATQKLSRQQQLTLCRSLHAEALQAIASEGFGQGPYVATRAGFEPATLRLKGIDSTNTPHLGGVVRVKKYCYYKKNSRRAFRLE